MIARRVLVLITSLAIALLTTLVLFQEKKNQASIEIEAAHGELDLAFTSLSVRMASMATALRQAQEVTPSLFAEVYAGLVQSSMRTHERAIALMPEFPDLSSVEAMIAAFSQDFAEAGYPDFRLFPEGTDTPLFPAVMVEPAEARRNVFGFNIGSSPERVIAAREALERGVMTTSAPVTLSQDANGADSSFLLLFPIRLPENGAPREFDAGVLGAGMTPRALFAAHVPLYDRHVIEIDMGIAGQWLRVPLGRSEVSNPIRVPLLRDVTLPAIKTPGFDVPFRASVFYIPRATDVMMPVSAGLVAAIIGFLLLNQFAAREAAKRRLEEALARKEAELREAYRIQARSQRIEALGRLVGGVAHDFNNILSVILGNLELLTEEDTSRVGDPLIAEAIGATQRGAHLTRQLLSVGRRSHLHPTQIDVAHHLQETTRMLSRVLPESIRLTTASASGLWRVKADPDGLQNALLNLAINARDAMDGTGQLTIEASNVRATQDYLEARPDEEITPGRYVCIAVSDVGAGMPPEIAERAFEPFFTTKHATDGSGLGLPSVLGFCKQSGGTCRIYSEVGVGTTVRMVLPVSEAEETELARAEPAAVADGSQARILLAEDEEGVARVIQRQLQAADYVVTCVSSGDAAWSAIERGEVFDLLITDLVMPGDIQGAELARRVEKARPEMRILLMSGYPQEAAIEGNGVASRHTVLTKPVPRSEMLRALERLLNGSQG